MNSAACRGRREEKTQVKENSLTNPHTTKSKTKKTNSPDFVASYNTWPEKNYVGFFDVFEPTRSRIMEMDTNSLAAGHKFTTSVGICLTRNCAP